MDIIGYIEVWEHWKEKVEGRDALVILQCCCSLDSCDGPNGAPQKHKLLQQDWYPKVKEAYDRM
jgi:hypothetical protein